MPKPSQTSGDLDRYTTPTTSLDANERDRLTNLVRVAQTMGESDGPSNENEPAADSTFSASLLRGPATVSQPPRSSLFESAVQTRTATEPNPVPRGESRQIDSLRSQISQLQSVRRQNDNLKTQIQLVEQKSRMREQEMGHKAGETVERLRYAEDAESSLRQEILSLEEARLTDKERYQSIINELDTRVRNLTLEAESRAEVVGRLEHELELTARNVQAHRQAIEERDAVNVNFSRQIQEAAAEMENILEKNKAETTELLEKLEETQDEMEREKEARKKVENECHQLQGQLGDMRDKLAASDQRCSDCEAKLDAANHRGEQIRASLLKTEARLKEKKEDVKKRTAELNAQERQHENEKKEWEGRMREVEERVRSSEREKGDLERTCRQQLSDAAAETNRVKSELDRAQNERNMMTQRSDGEVQQLRSNLEQERMRTRQAEDRLRELESKLQQCQMELNTNRQAQPMPMPMPIPSEGGAREAISAATGALREQLSERGKQIESLNQEVERLNAQLRHAKGSLDERAASSSDVDQVQDALLEELEDIRVAVQDMLIPGKDTTAAGNVGRVGRRQVTSVIAKFSSRIESTMRAIRGDLARIFNELIETRHQHQESSKKWESSEKKIEEGGRARDMEVTSIKQELANARQHLGIAEAETNELRQQLSEADRDELVPDRDDDMEIEGGHWDSVLSALQRGSAMAKETNDELVEVKKERDEAKETLIKYGITGNVSSESDLCASLHILLRAWAPLRKRVDELIGQKSFLMSRVAYLEKYYADSNDLASALCTDHDDGKLRPISIFRSAGLAVLAFNRLKRHGCGDSMSTISSRVTIADETVELYPKHAISDPLSLDLPSSLLAGCECGDSYPASLHLSPHPSPHSKKPNNAQDALALLQITGPVNTPACGEISVLTRYGGDGEGSSGALLAIRQMALKLAKRMKDQQDTITSLREKVAELELVLTEVTALQDRVAVMENERAAESEMQLKQISELDDARILAQAQVRDLTQATSEMGGELETKTALIEQLQRELAQRESELQQVDEYMTEKKGEMEVMRDEADTASSARRKLEDQVKTLSAERDVKTAVLNRLEDTVASLTTELDQARDANTELIKDVERKTKEIKSAEDLNAALSNAHMKANERVVSLEQHVVDYKQHCSDLRSELQAAVEREEGEKFDKLEASRARLQMLGLRSAVNAELGQRKDPMPSASGELGAAAARTSQLESLVATLDATLDAEAKPEKPVADLNVDLSEAMRVSLLRHRYGDRCGDEFSDECSNGDGSVLMRFDADEADSDAGGPPPAHPLLNDDQFTDLKSTPQ